MLTFVLAFIVVCFDGSNFLTRLSVGTSSLVVLSALLWCLWTSSNIAPWTWLLGIRGGLIRGVGNIHERRHIVGQVGRDMWTGFFNLLERARGYSHGRTHADTTQAATAQGAHRVASNSEV